MNLSHQYLSCLLPPQEHPGSKNIVETITLVCAFVTTRINYCKSLLYGISDYNINHLQHIKNGVGGIVTI